MLWYEIKGYICKDSLIYLIDIIKQILWLYDVFSVL